MNIAVFKNLLKTPPRLLFFVILGLFLCASGFAQENLGTDDLYTKARNTAFKEDNYPEAIRLTKMALAKSPDYLEVSVFLGRLYTFTDSLSQARMVFNEVLRKEAGHEDASLAYANLEYWNNDSPRALEIVNAGIEIHPKSEDLLLLKAKILKDLEEYSAASETINTLLKINPKITAARELSQTIQTVSAKNSISASYDYVYFDKRFDDAWHLGSLSYGRQTKLGSVTARFNYANRFQTNGTQFEIDMYPRISDLFYTYVSGGISNKDGIFPHYRAGFSLYANLPAAFEADAGFRMLAFSDQTWIYTIGVGKYYKNYWFNLRTYLTPSNSSVSQSYSLNIRYYLGGADDYISFKIGTGISPDDSTANVLYDSNNIYKLKSNNIALGYQTTFSDTNVISIQASLDNQEYARNTHGNQITLGLGYSKRF
ncbi:MAG: YaiO family outer membrane beta-barrel protein [Leeuwenhoekiella sp.]